MRITFPRVLSVRRADPNRFSVGDEAVCEFGPGLFDFLNLRNRDGTVIGDGLASEWTIPIAAAINAMYAVLFPAGREDLNQFTGLGNIANRSRPCEPGETLLGRAWIESAGRKIKIRYRVVSRERLDELVEGTITFMSTGPRGLGVYDPRLFPDVDPVPASVPTRLPSPSPALIDSRHGLADTVLPQEVTRILRTGYWHWLDRSEKRTPVTFARGLIRALRNPEALGLPARATTPLGRLVDVFVPAGVARRLRERKHRLPGKIEGVRPSLSYLQIKPAPVSLALGETARVVIQVGNPTDHPFDGLVKVAEPFGFGLAFSWESPFAFSLAPGEAKEVVGRVTALRPDEVNLGKPWSLRCTLTSGTRELAKEALQFLVPDVRPGALFYVLTEDCETFDGGGLTGAYGAASVLGNHNDYMDPEEYRVQMIEKPNALNAIAERHGAVWTHFWTVPQRFAAAWAAGQSRTGAWDEIVRDLDESVRRGSRRHEYAPHIHFDFEPDSQLPPQPRLRYDPRTDGFLPNDYYDPATNPDHRYHGWDGARKGIAYVKREGDLSILDSKKGSLRKTIRLLADLSLGGVPSVTTRTGACDFGNTAADLDISTRALLANGLLANADSGLYYSGKPEPRGRQIYFCRRDDLDVEIDDLSEARLVEVRASDQQLESGSIDDLNAWFDRRVRESQGPGVRAIVGVTHAMFVKGSPDSFRDTSGGDFQKIDDHLTHVRKVHPGVQFATASDAVFEFLDYYTPTLRAVAVKPRARSLDGKTSLYPIRILGKGIPLSPDHPARLQVLAPSLFDPDRVFSLSILERGRIVEKVEGPFGWDQLPTIEFLATAFEGYDLKLQTGHKVGHSLSDAEDADAQRLFESPTVLYEELPESQRPDVFGLDRPTLIEGPSPPEPISPGTTWAWRFPGSLFRLLVNPAGGGNHPIGRRFHPYAMFSEGVILYCAQRAFGDSWKPEHSEVRWIRPQTGTGDFRVVAKVESSENSCRELSATFLEGGVVVAHGLVRMRPSGGRN